MRRLAIRCSDDFHVHLRRGPMLRKVLLHTERWCGRALVMPNTDPPILTAQDVVVYRHEIKAASKSDFEPLMTVKLVQSTTPKIIAEAREAGALAAKFYPKDATTNSADGIEDIHLLDSVFKTMEKMGMVLCLHGEVTSGCCLDREEKFLNSLQALTDKFPRLKIVLEHLSTAAAVSLVKRLPDTVAGTITPHHLLLTIDDVIGRKICPHNFCMPIPKRVEDRDALVAAATSGNPKFFLGTDSAPHLREHKECAEGASGVFNAPVALPLLAQIFEEADALSELGHFTSRFGAQFYNLPMNGDEIDLIRTPWEVPQEYDGIIPFKAKETLSWKLA